MTESFFFYDLETSGFSPRAARIMQFAGQRTNLKLEPIGEPVNVLIKMTEDVLPDPRAILVTGITPQKTIKEGITEAEFLRKFEEEIATPDTIFVGYNTVRFDDEFMRFIHYRNFYDPYEWQWKDGKSRWDLLDVVRMTRALRPDGIKWPFDAEGRPTNRLELLTVLNKLSHAEAHDALSDVLATIEVAKLIQSKQPKLFAFLLNLRHKNEVAKVVQAGEPFLYTSGKYPGEFEKTTVAATLADHPERQGVLVYDLRHDPEPFAKMSAKELAEAWKFHKDSDEPQLPIKTLQFNRCPAIAPLSVLDKASEKRLKLDMKIISSNRQKLTQIKHWPERVFEALQLMNAEQDKRYVKHSKDVDAQLYDGFFNDSDRRAMGAVRVADAKELSKLEPQFKDARLKKLLPLYKARNFPKSLSDDERAAWHEHVANRLLAGEEDSRLAKFEAQIQEIAAEDKLTSRQQELLNELEAYAESIMPVDGGGS